jgi:hypothetical protein
MFKNNLSKFSLSAFLSCAALVTFPNFSSADPNKIYFGNVSGNVYKANPDGTGVELIQTVSGVVYGLDVDSKNDKLYIAATSDVYRSNLDGSNLETLITLSTGSVGKGDDLINQSTFNDFSDVAVDMKEGHLYYSTTRGLIGRTNLDGSNNTEIVSVPSVTANISTSYSSIRAIDLDLKNGKIYWVDENRGRVQRCNLDGTQIEVVVPEDLSAKGGISVDSYNNEAYFTDSNSGEVKKVLLANNQVQSLFQGLQYPLHIDADVLGGKLYFTDYNASSVLKANLDGSSASGITGGQGALTSIALEITPDLDFDRVPAGEDLCDLDSQKLSPGVCGCGVADDDEDNNRVVDCLAEELPMDESLKVLSALRDTNFKNGLSDELLASYRELVASVSAAGLRGYQRDLNRLRRTIVRLNFLRNEKNSQEEFKVILAKALQQIKKIRKKLSQSSQS